MRVNFDGYKEYHTSLDNKKIINFNKLKENIKILENVILYIDKAKFYKRRTILYVNPLSKRKLYNTLSKYTHYSKIDKIVEAIFGYGLHRWKNIRYRDNRYIWVLNLVMVTEGI